LVFDDQGHRQDLIEIEQDRTGRRGFPRGEREAAPEKIENSEDRELSKNESSWEETRAWEDKLRRRRRPVLKAHVSR
jgi:hypothetical protein